MKLSKQCILRNTHIHTHINTHTHTHHHTQPVKLNLVYVQ